MLLHLLEELTGLETNDVAGVLPAAQTATRQGEEVLQATSGRALEFIRGELDVTEEEKKQQVAVCPMTTKAPVLTSPLQSWSCFPNLSQHAARYFHNSVASGIFNPDGGTH